MRTDRGVRLQLPWVAAALSLALVVGTPVSTRLFDGRAEAAPSSPRGEAAPASPRVEAPPASASRAALPGPIPTRDARRPARGTTAAHLLVHARSGVVARKNPWAAAPSLGTVATVSKYYGFPLVWWVEEVSANGKWGRVELPYFSPRTEGWIALTDLTTESTFLTVDVDLSTHTLRVTKRGETLLKADAAIGAASSPTPPGDYVVTDRVAFSAGSYLGSFAFGISGIQPRLPAGWTGGNQLAIHGTNQPWSIGRSVSAGCVRAAEWTLERLKPLLRQGTPVVIHP